MRYDDPKVPLSLTDLDRMDTPDAQVESVEDGQFQALVLSFTLGSSQYATMALRELMKMPLLAQFQKTTNVE